MIYNYDYDYWSIDHSVTFDGDNRLIIVNPNVSEISIKTDVYSSWKEWSRVRDNLKFLPAIRTTGGDPIGSGQYTGDVYFLINGWKLMIDVRKTKVSGVLFSDDYASAYYDLDTNNIMYPVQVSSIVNTVVSKEGSISVSDVWSYQNRSLTQMIASATDIAEHVRLELTPELSRVMTLENNPGMTNAQATMLTELYAIMGLDPTKPLIVTQTHRTAGTEISQTIQTSTAQTTVVRT